MIRVRPPLSDIRRSSAETLRAHRAYFRENPTTETTPTALTPAIADFAAKLGAAKPIRIPVVDDPMGLYGWCSVGVREKIKHDGGSPLFGWAFWEWPSAVLTAEFHCVWVAPSGGVSDITPKACFERDILFAPDRRYGPDFDFDLRPRNRRISLYPKKGRDAPADNRGTPVTMGLYDKIAEFIEVCDRQEAKCDALGIAGLINIDQELMHLSQRRFELFEELGTLL